MKVARRGYYYLVCFASLQAVTWAAIRLLRQVLAPSSASPAAQAFQIAVVVVGAPLFLVHWRWAQTAALDGEERAAGLRRLYLLVTMALFGVPWLANAFGWLAGVLRAALGAEIPAAVAADQGVAALTLRNGAALVALGVLWAYHRRILAADQAQVAEAGRLRTMGRLYDLGAAALGGALGVTASVQILRGIMVTLFSGPATVGSASVGVLADQSSRLIVGIALWMVAWAAVQRRLASENPEEEASALRKLYLYGWIFVSVLATLANVAIIAAGALRGLLGLSLPGDPSGPLPLVLVLSVTWAYHRHVLGQEGRLGDPAGRQAAVRRLYDYLVSIIALAAFLVGTAGIVRTLIRALLAASAGTELRSAIAWFAAAVIVALPAWVVVWTRVQARVQPETRQGEEESRSAIRHLYLYAVLAVSAIAVLSGAVYVLYRGLAMALGASTPGEGAHAVAETTGYALIGAIAWLYHLRVLQRDESTLEALHRDRLAALQVAFVGLEEDFAARLTQAARSRGIVGTTTDSGAVSAADVVVMRASAAGTTGGTLATDNGAPATARLLLLPRWTPAVEWIGLDRMATDEQIHQVVHALALIADGEPVQPERGLSVGQALGIAVGALIFLGIAIPLVAILAGAGIGYLF